MDKQDRQYLRDRVRMISQNHVPHEPMVMFVTDAEYALLQRWAAEAPDSHPTLVIQPAQLAL